MRSLLLLSVGFAASYGQFIQSDIQAIANSCGGQLKSLCPVINNANDFVDCFNNNFQCISSACQAAVAQAIADANSTTASFPPLPQIATPCLSAFQTACGSQTTFAAQMSCWAAIDPSTLPLNCILHQQNNLPPPPTTNFFMGNCSADIASFCSTVHHDIATQAGCLALVNSGLSAGCTTFISQFKTGLAACSPVDYISANCSSLNVPCLLRSLNSVSGTCSSYLQANLPPPPPTAQPPYVDPLAACKNGNLNTPACLSSVTSAVCSSVDLGPCASSANVTALIHCVIKSKPILSPSCATFVAQVLAVAGHDVVPPPPVNINPFSVCSSASLQNATACPPPSNPFSKADVICFVNNLNHLKVGGCQALIGGIGAAISVACAPELLSAGLTFSPVGTKLANLFSSTTLGQVCATAVNSFKPQNRRALAAAPGPIATVISACATEFASYCSYLPPSLSGFACLYANETLVSTAYSTTCQSAITTAVASFPLPSDLINQCTLELNQLSQSVSLSNPTCASASGFALLLCIKQNLNAFTPCTGTSCCASLANAYITQRNGPNGDVRDVCSADFGNLCAGLVGNAMVTCVNTNYASFSSLCQAAITSFLANQKLTGHIIPPPKSNTGCSVIDQTTYGGSASLVLTSSNVAVSASYALVSPTQSPGGPTSAPNTSNGVSTISSSLVLTALTLIALILIM